MKYRLILNQTETYRSGKAGMFVRNENNHLENYSICLNVIKVHYKVTKATCLFVRR